MKLDDMMDEWEKDSQMDQSELGLESLRIPTLHHKYFKIFSQEGLLLKKLESDYKVLLKLKTMYYMGTLSEEELRTSLGTATVENIETRSTVVY